MRSAVTQAALWEHSWFSLYRAEGKGTHSPLHTPTKPEAPASRAPLLRHFKPCYVPAEANLCVSDLQALVNKVAGLSRSVMFAIPRAEQMSGLSLLIRCPAGALVVPMGILCLD